MRLRPTLRLLCVPVVATLLAAPFAGPARAQILDQGTFKLYQGDRALGAETFTFESAAESLVVRARQSLVVPTSQGDETLDKAADLLLGRHDYMLRQYQSNRNFRGGELIRALIVADTHYVAYREGEGRIGTGDARVLPPGRLFVMDSQLVTLFDLIVRSVHGQAFESRPINLLALGPRDTMLEASVVERGTETIRWGAKPVVAHKLEIVADSRTTFTAWTGTNGELLRLTEPMSGLRVEREAPPVKRRAAAPPKSRAAPAVPRSDSVSRRPGG
jgi:hypothetical protein